MQALQKIPKQVISSGAIPVVFEQITTMNTLVEILSPPFCPICEKFILKGICGEKTLPKNCPITDNTNK